MKLKDRLKSTLGLTEERRMARLIAREVSRQTAEVQGFQAKQIATAKVRKLAEKTNITLREQFGLSSIGMPYSDPDPKAYMYRNFSATAGGKQLASLQPDRKLSEIHQDYLNRIGVWLYYTNPIISAAIDIEVGLIVGNGFKVTAEHPKVQKVLDDHWKHFRNNWDELQYNYVLDLKLFGELCLPIVVMKPTGIVTLGYIDPYLIGEVEVDQSFPQIPAAVKLKSALLAERKDTTGILKIIGRDDNGFYNDGTAFYFTLSKLLSASRGFSPLLCMADWADALDRLIFARGEIRAQIGRYVWDVKLTGKGQPECDAFAASLDATQGTGIHRVHNENVEWAAVAPSMGASDADADAELLKSMYLAGTKLPTHWIFQQGDTTNRACHDDKTEVLTPTGWMLWSEYMNNGRGQLMTCNESFGLEFSEPSKYYEYDYDGELLEIDAKRINMAVTPEHRILLKRVKTNTANEVWEILKAKEVPRHNRFRIPHIFDWEKESIREYFVLPSCAFGNNQSRAIYPELQMSIKPWLEFLGYFISEGHIHTKRTSGYLVNLSQKKGEIADKIQNCLNQIGLICKRHEDDKGMVRWQINDKALNLWLRNNCGDKARNKQIPEQLWNYNPEQLEILFQALIAGDGSRDPRKGRNCILYSTTSKTLADQIQILCLLTGRTATVRQSYNEGHRNSVRHACWHVSIIEHNGGRTSKHPVILGSSIKSHHYKGKTYCVTVPSGMVITRRNGKIAVSGNSALAMGDPVCKRLSSEQNRFIGIMRAIFDYQLAMAQQYSSVALSGVLPEEMGYEITGTTIAVEDESQIATTLLTTSQALLNAEDRQWISKEEAGDVFKAKLSKLGYKGKID